MWVLLIIALQLLNCALAAMMFSRLEPIEPEHDKVQDKEIKHNNKAQSEMQTGLFMTDKTLSAFADLARAKLERIEKR